MEEGGAELRKTLLSIKPHYTESSNPNEQINLWDISDSPLYLHLDSYCQFYFTLIGINPSYRSYSWSLFSGIHLIWNALIVGISYLIIPFIIVIQLTEVGLHWIWI
jgi:hypothetical protein